jgi:chromate transporter
MERLTLARLAGIYLRVGNLTFGGGDPTIVALQRELSHRYGWLSNEQFALSFALARVTPGTNLLAFCAGAAWLLLGWAGAIVAVIVATIPSAALVVWLTIAFESAQHPVAAGAVRGATAAVVGMMAAAVWILLKPHFRQARAAVRAVTIFAGAMLLFWEFQLSPLQLIAISAVVGWFWREPDVS